MDKIQIVECLKCNDIYSEEINSFVETCPHCGNTETEDTIYLSEDSLVSKEFLKEL